MKLAGKCRVERLVDVTGPNGGTWWCLVLACGGWVYRSPTKTGKPPERVSCIGCFLRSQVVAALASGPP